MLFGLTSNVLSKCSGWLLAILALAAWTAAQSPTPSPSPAPGDKGVRSIRKCWEYPAAEINARGVKADDTAVYLAETSGKIEAVAADSGSRIWSDELGGEIVSNIAETASAVFIVTKAGGDTDGVRSKASVRSLSKTTGITNWVIEMPSADSVYLGISKERLIAIASTGQVTAFNTGGSPSWTAELAGKVSVEPSFSVDSIMIATEAGEVVILSAENGAVRIKRATPYKATAVLLAGSDKAAWGDERGNVYFFAIDGLKFEWKIKHGAGISDLRDLGETILAASNDNFVYSVAAYNGNVRWKRRQPDRMFAPALLDGGLVVMASRSGGSTMIVEWNHGKTIENIALGTDIVNDGPPQIGGARLILPAGGKVTAYSFAGCTGK